MRKTHSRRFRVIAALILLIAQPMSLPAVVSELSLTKVPPDTKVTLIGEDRSDRVEARTREKGGDGRLSFQLQERNWSSGRFILNIYEPAGTMVSELIELKDGANEIDLSMILGEPPLASADSPTETQPNGGVAGALAGATASGIVVGRGGEARVDRRQEEYRTSDDDRRSRGSGRAAAGAAIGSALLGALASSLFSGPSKPPPSPAPPASSLPAGSAAAQPGAEFVANRVLATIALADLPVMQALAQAIAADHNLNFIAVNALDSLALGLAEFTILDALDPLAKAAELAGDVRVESAQPELIYQTTARQEQLFYGPRLIRADKVPPSVSGKGVRVALIDTGVDRERPELKNKIQEAVDMTGKGLSADVHGTMLAGIIAAERDIGIGVAPSVGILAVKSCWANRPQRIEGTCWSSTLARGIDFANTKAARVINLSVGGPKDNLIARLIDEAVKRRIAVVAAAGNDGPKGQPRYPAALDNVIAVTAVDIERRLYPNATLGKFIDVAAPGVEIVSVGPGARFPISSGTSFGAAHVTGAIALLLEQRASFAPADLQAALEKSAADLGEPGKDEQFGSGLVDICQAMQQLDLPHPCR